MVPDKVTDILMAAYTQLTTPQQKLALFKLLVAEFGVQREHLQPCMRSRTRTRWQPSCVQAMFWGWAVG